MSSERLNINSGTQNKGTIMRKALELFKQWNEGDINIWAKRLGFFCNIGTRAAKENYIEQAISVGILEELSGNRVKYIDGVIPDGYFEYKDSKDKIEKKEKEEIKKSGKKEKKQSKNDMSKDNKKIIYDIYVKNCKKDEETPLPFDEWLLNREFDEYVDKSGDTDITYSEWCARKKGDA